LTVTVLNAGIQKVGAMRPRALQNSQDGLLVNIRKASSGPDTNALTEQFNDLNGF
jgi:hypothetical protein